ncbi:uncharacterized protein [Henckelia pumila]|uniref:uncharacterized protein n=1 Tax=Henckelia pumila TaxID=405737 RepID=UPI003C6E61E2
MTHPDASGRLVKWSVELGEYDIEYQPRKAIKAQALSDFLTEVAIFGQEEVWRVFVDGASGVGGSGVGVILISPTQEKIEIAVKMDFQASNNEGEYEAVIAGMQRAREVGVSHIIIYSDSQLVVQQVKKTFCTREEKLVKYCKIIEELGASFTTWSIEQIPREENMEADALAKRAVTGENDGKESLVQREMMAAIEAREPVLREDTWMAPMVKYLTHGDLPEDKGQARVIRRQADASKIARSCEGCQRFGNIQHSPASRLNPVWASCPFDQWGLNIVGPFSQARAQKKFLLVAVDYFSKWVEAEPLAKITEAEVMKFLWKNIVCRFGLPRKLVSDNGRQFQGQKLADWLGCMEWGKTGLKRSPSVLWAYRTTPHTATQESPFSLVYGSEAVLPVEIGQPSARIRAYEDTEEGARAQELDLIEERREKAARRMEAYRARVMRAYNRKVKPRELQEGELVLKRVNPAGKVGKLDARWEGPYKLIRKVGANTWYLQDSQGRPLKRPWNALHLKKYFM